MREGGLGKTNSKINKNRDVASEYFKQQDLEAQVPLFTDQTPILFIASVKGRVEKDC